MRTGTSVPPLSIYMERKQKADSIPTPLAVETLLIRHDWSGEWK
jgi:hypothetical protein